MTQSRNAFSKTIPLKDSVQDIWKNIHRTIHKNFIMKSKEYLIIISFKRAKNG